MDHDRPNNRQDIQSAIILWTKKRQLIAVEFRSNSCLRNILKLRNAFRLRCKAGSATALPRRPWRSVTYCAGRSDDGLMRPGNPGTAPPTAPGQRRAGPCGAAPFECSGIRTGIRLFRWPSGKMPSRVRSPGGGTPDEHRYGRSTVVRDSAPASGRNGRGDLALPARLPEDARPDQVSVAHRHAAAAFIAAETLSALAPRHDLPLIRSTGRQGRGRRAAPTSSAQRIGQASPRRLGRALSPP